jgi:hypothetical protein
MASEERKAFLLRISPDLWRDLEKWAGDDLRSVNGQIEYILRQAVAKRKRIPDGGPDAVDPVPAKPDVVE